MSSYDGDRREFEGLDRLTRRVRHQIRQAQR